MKAKPNTTPPAPKTYYVMEIDNQQFSTYATSDQSAISNAAYQYATRQGEDVRLVKWEIKSGEMGCRIVEGKQ
jgi:hypothetical protein